ncbi:acyloxyacyl hydrolase [Lutimonas saemankumensis]|uniref:acyloxyacyl hydrolase n=1 Tax=Lutimonas saemankumensis TaxID=483016 RepID=UPI001CD1CF5F|nr:acyloxyacyl hydrolase [Lutimonas saemankumensis]MCA0932690.1 acyloxyacyl hydrolase [Lutimonas saemankumensis]
MTSRLLKLHPPTFSTIALFLFLLSGFFIDVYAQSDTINFEDVKDVKNFGRFRYIEVKGHTGYHLYAGELLNESVNQGYGAIEVRYGWQNTNPDHWTSRYGHATYGIGYYSGFVGNPSVLGKPNAVFGFVNFPLSYPGKKNELEIGLGLGLTYNLEPYDPVSNPENDAIGSPFAVYFNLYFGGAYKMTREVDLLYGIDFTHFSNGRMTTPNYGFNMYGINLGLRYYYNVDQRKLNNDVYTKEILQARFERPESSEPKKLRESSVEMVLAAGTVQNEEDKGTSKRYGIFSGVLDYRYKFNSMHAITAGFDFFYDGSLEPEYPEPSDQWLYGAHIGYDFMFGRFAARLQAGAYLSDDKGKTPSYLRAAFRYDINKWLFTQLAIKTKNTSRADWVEFGIGFTPFKW